MLSELEVGLGEGMTILKRQDFGSTLRSDLNRKREKELG